LVFAELISSPLGADSDGVEIKGFLRVPGIRKKRGKVCHPLTYGRTIRMNDKNFDSSANTDRLESFECKDITARLGDLVDNDMPDNERKAVEAHLDECAECAAFFASYRHIVQSAAELREPERPLQIDVQNRLRKALNTRLGLTLPYIA
jgi:hypothetical protein